MSAPPDESSVQAAPRRSLRPEPSIPELVAGVAIVWGVQLAIVAGMGLLWTLLRHLTRSLVPSIILHWAYNAVVATAAVLVALYAR